MADGLTTHPAQAEPLRFELRTGERWGPGDLVQLIEFLGEETLGARPTFFCSFPGSRRSASYSLDRVCAEGSSGGLNSFALATDAGPEWLTALSAGASSRLIRFEATNPAWAASTFEEIEGLFRRLVEVFDPVVASGGFALMDDVGAALFGPVLVANADGIPCYSWLHGSCGGVGATGQTIVRLGPTPVQPLARRDELRSKLEASLPAGPARSRASWLDGWHVRCLLASPDGGAELGAEDEPLAAPLAG